MPLIPRVGLGVAALVLVAITVWVVSFVRRPTPVEPQVVEPQVVEPQAVEPVETDGG